MVEARPSSSSGKTDINLDSGAAAPRMGTGANEGLGSLAPGSQRVERGPLLQSQSLSHIPRG